MSIYKVYFSEQDSSGLVGREAPKVLKTDVEFMKLVVNKPWGYEYIMYDGPYSQVWSLFIKPKAMTSTHSHPNKKTSLILISGEAVFSTLNGSFRLKPFDAVVIDPAVFHTTQAVSPEGARVLEIESPPIKYDLIRMKDSYGREGKFYEGIDQMRANENSCVRFENDSRPNFAQKRFFNTLISIKNIAQAYSKEDLFQLADHDLLTVLEGNVHSKEGGLLFSITDVVKCTDFMSRLDSHVINNLTVFLIKNPVKAP